MFKFSEWDLEQRTTKSTIIVYTSLDFSFARIKQTPHRIVCFDRLQCHNNFFHPSCLEIERSDTSSDRVCHACACRIRLHNFISSSLQKEKQAGNIPDDLSRCKGLLPTTVSLPDSSPQTRKGRKTSDYNSIAVKFSDNVSEIAL